MDPYTMERWFLERHEAVIRNAEFRSRLGRDESRERLAGRLAAMLRRLADQLEEQPQSEPAPQA